MYYALAPIVLIDFSWTAVILLLVLLIFVFYLLFSIKYVINGSMLNIKCGFLANDKVDIMQITKIEPTKSFISVPAASLDRIAIYLNKQCTPVIISPKNQKEFIERLKSINNDIDVDSME